MYKPASLRNFLTTANPELGRDPDRLLVFIDEGQLLSTLAPGLSFEYAYTLHLVLTDYAGHPDAVMAPLLVWLRQHQPDLLANPDARGKITFEADLLANDKVDLSIRVPLTERVGVHPRMGGDGFDITHYQEPVVDDGIAQNGAVTIQELWLNGQRIAYW